MIGNRYDTFQSFSHYWATGDKVQETKVLNDCHGLQRNRILSSPYYLHITQLVKHKCITNCLLTAIDITAFLTTRHAHVCTTSTMVQSIEIGYK